jgi:membrane protease subunit HflK
MKVAATREARGVPVVAAVAAVAAATVTVAARGGQVVAAGRHRILTRSSNRGARPWAGLCQAVADQCPCSVIIAIAIWAVTGFYRVNPQQQGVVLRFGEWVRTTAPGLHYHIPYPFESVMTPEVTRDNRIEIGFRDISGNSSSRRDIADESQMITGDENIVDIDFVVFWRISDAGQYLFNLAEPDQTIKVAAEAVMREIIGRTPIQTALTEGRQDIQIQARAQLQDLLDEYVSGVRVRDVQLLAVDPPADVIDAFNEVQRARPGP